MKIQVLGSAGAEMPNYHMAGYLVDGTVLLDAGTIGLALDFKDQMAIRNIFLSHSHLDHIKALPFLADNIVNNNGNHSVNVHSTREVLDIIKKNVFNDLVWPDFSVIPTPDNPIIRFVPVEVGRAVELEKHRVTAYAVNHAVPAAGFLVENSKGKKIIYTGDTGPTEDIWSACDENVIDALIVEVSLPNRMKEVAVKAGHLTPDLLAKEVLKMKMMPLNFLICHVKPYYTDEIYEELADISGDFIEVLKDGQVITL